MSRNNRLTEDNRFLISILNRIHQDNNQAILSIVNSTRENITNNILLINLNSSNHEIQNTIMNILRDGIEVPINQRNRAPGINNMRETYSFDANLYTIPNRPARRNLNTNSNTNWSTLLQNFLNPIEIHPTQANIEIATRNVRFSDIVSPSNISCPITLECFNDSDQVLVIRHCGHIFSTSGLTSWFASNCRCPICRYDIRNYTPNVTSDSTSNNVNEERNINNTNTNNESIIASLISNYMDNIENDNIINDVSGNYSYFI